MHAEHAGVAGDLQVVFEAVARQRGVVGLDVELEVLVQTVRAQEADAGRAVEIVLVLHRFHRLGLDEEVAGEADAAPVVAGRGQEPRHVLLLALHLRVVQAGVALAAAPEHVVRAAQCHRRIQRRLDLHRSARDDGEVRVGRCTVHVARVREQVRRAPQQLHAGGLLALLGQRDHVLQVLFVFADVVGIR